MSPRATTAEIKARLDAVRDSHRGNLRWKISSETAELAIRALSGRVTVSYRPGSKSRRRKRHKRLL